MKSKRGPPTPSLEPPLEKLQSILKPIQRSLILPCKLLKHALSSDQSAHFSTIHDRLITAKATEGGWGMPLPLQFQPILHSIQASTPNFASVQEFDCLMTIDMTSDHELR